MRALTLWQPWAQLVALGHKRIETRSWGTNYRGPLVIHAALYFPREAQARLLEPAFVRALGRDTAMAFPLGKVVAVCRLAGCERCTARNTPGEPERSFGDYGPGRWLWRLEDVRALAVPVAACGKQGLWEWEPAGELALAGFPAETDCYGREK